MADTTGTLDVHAVVEAAWVKAFGQASWDENRPFDEAGSDSLEMLNVVFEIETAIGVDIPNDIITVEMTPQDLVAMVARFVAAPPAAVAADDRPEVFLLVAGDPPSGLTVLQSRLAAWFRFTTVPPEGTAERIAARRPSGPVNLIGLGAAASAAFGAARALGAAGFPSGFTILLDPAAPTPEATVPFAGPLWIFRGKQAPAADGWRGLAARVEIANLSGEALLAAPNLDSLHSHIIDAFVASQIH